MMAGSALSVCLASEIVPGERRVVSAAGVELVVLNCAGELFAIENRCSHEDTPLADGELDETDCSIECPHHGSRFDLRTGRALSLPAYEPIEVFPVEVIDDVVTVEID
jgi:3-phenylpropionate/trans-cinnamate dioxygenase ferredoxin component